MAVTVGQPAPGATQAGDLYVDLQTLQIWLGVDILVDPSGSVLISDIAAIAPAIAAGVANANSYTDVKLLNYAPLISPVLSGAPRAATPPFADDSTRIATTEWVKDLFGGNDPLQIPQNVIWLYYGSVAMIGVGALAGWALCDGTNGTPDLRDRFVIGAGNKPVGAVNATTQFNTTAAGDHSHTISGTALTVAQMPAHTHPVSVTGSGSGSGTTGSAGAHTHTFPTASDEDGSALVHRDGSTSSGTMSTSSAGAHTHPFSVSVDVSATGTASTQGGGATHTHTASSEGLHSHTVTNAQIREAVPYYALAFIMKL